MSVADVVVLTVAAALSGWFFDAITRIDAWREVHHFYYGAALVALAFGLTPPRRDWLFWLLIGLGLLGMADDAYQHWRQASDRAYRSPLHRLYAATLYRWISR